MAYKGQSKIHYYKGYAIFKPEGTTWWNVYKVDDRGQIDWLHHEGYGQTMRECRNGIDAWEAEGQETMTCSECGAVVTCGYVADGGREYYCCDECRRKHYTDDEWDNSDNYWVDLEL